MSINLLIAILCLSILFISPAWADETTESFVVYTDKQVYMVGEHVNIYVKANSIDPNETITVTDVIVYDPNNSSVAEWHNISIVLTDATTAKYIGTFIAASEGSHTVYAEATGCKWILKAFWHFFCCWWKHFHAIPEYPFGTIAAVAAFFGALCLNVARKQRHIYNRRAN